MTLTQFAQTFELNEDQQALFTHLEDFRSSAEHQVFLLKGYAGVGKTYVMSVLTKYLIDIEHEFVLMAPTGKAARVLASKCNVPTSTIHGRIYNCSEEIKVETLQDRHYAKRHTRCYQAESQYASNCIFIIDEASMISDQYVNNDYLSFGSGRLLKDLMKYVQLDKYPQRKVIFIGDEAQLPPVRMNTSPALCKDYLSDHFNVECMQYELKQVVRQKAENSITPMLLKLRNGEIEPYLYLPKHTPLSAHITSVPFNELKNLYEDLTSGNIENADKIAVIAYTNWVVKQYNELLRQVFFGEDAAIAEGERVVTVARYAQESFSIANSEFGKIVKLLSDVEIRSIPRHQLYPNSPDNGITIDLAFIDVQAEFQDTESKRQNFKAKVILNSLKGSTPHLDAIEERALAQDFAQRHANICPQSEEYAALLQRDPYMSSLRLNYGYAFTCHKAQGSEWPVVILDGFMNTHNTQNMKNWFYTAVSRTSEELIAINHIDEHNRFYHF